MKRLNDQFIIGVDHGYGNIKTANHCFKTGILGYDSEPLFTGDMSTCHNTQKTASAHAFVFLFFVFFHFIHLKNKSNEKVLLKIE